MPIPELYHSCRKMLRELCPGERITRTRNFSWLMVGLYKSRSVHLSKVAENIPGGVYLPSVTRRLRRLLNNPSIQVRSSYEPLAESIIQRLAHGEIRLIVDGSKVGFGHQLLLVAIAYRRRSIPLAWTWVKGNRGHSTAHKQIALLTYVHRLMPDQSRVFLVGDAEFGEVDVQKLLQKWHWKYVVRQKGRYLCKTNEQRSYQRLDSFVTKPGQSQWLENVLLTAKHAYLVNFLAYWKPGEKAPWLLATNLTCSQAMLKAYRRRLWIEETFGDLKKNGFDLESTHLRHFLRLSRLTLAVVLLYVWLVALVLR